MDFTYDIFSVEKLLTIELMKLSRMTTALMAFQSVAFSPNRRQIDSKASFTTAGGFAIDRTSTSCCFLISFTAEGGQNITKCNSNILSKPRSGT